METTFLLKKKMASQTVVIVEEELDGIRDLVDLPRLMFIDEECRNLSPIQDGLFRGCSWMWRPKRLPKICHTYATMMKLGTVIPYLKKIQKLYE